MTDVNENVKVLTNHVWFFVGEDHNQSTSSIFLFIATVKLFN